MDDNFNFESYEKRLSPFGQKVLRFLVQQQNADKRIQYNTFGLQGSDCLPQYHGKRNKQDKLIPVDINNIGRKKCCLKFDPNNVVEQNPHDTLSFDGSKSEHGIFYRDDLINSAVTSDYEKEIKNKPKQCSPGSKNIIGGALSNHIHGNALFESENITWNDMFSSDLFQYGTKKNCDHDEKKILKTIPSTEPLQSAHISMDETGIRCRKLDKSFNILPETEIKPVKKKNIYRKEKYTKTVKNWLSDIEQEVPNNALGSVNIEHKDKVIADKPSRTSLNACSDDVLCDNTDEIYHSMPSKKTNRKKEFKKTIQKESSKKEHVKNKKVVQAQLANKDGIMKFDKPKNVDDPNVNQKGVTTPNDVTMNIEVVKEKKNKKFVAPIKSQIPVEEITYNVFELNDARLDYSHLLTECKSSEISVVLVYSNGFCQLNGCYTEDTCVPVGLMISVYYESKANFYYFTKMLEYRPLLTLLFERNTINSYECKSILIFLAQFGMKFNSLSIFDAKIGGALLDPDYPPETFSDLQKLVDYTPQFTIATDSPLQKIAWYMTLLKDCSVKLKNLLIKNSLWNVFIDLEMRLVPIIACMESLGVTVDVEKLKSMEQLLVGRMRTVEQECQRAAGRPFQINSAPQLRSLLFEDLKLDTKCNIKIRETLVKGAKSTSEAMLRSLMSAHELPRLVLEYRHVHKAYSTFVAGIAQHVKDGVVRPTWVQTAAVTGRIASNNPNLQAIPKEPFKLIMFPESEDMANPVVEFRSVYVARAGSVLLAADFRHVECRVLAHAANDRALRDALDGDDLFAQLAATWLNKSVESVTAAERERTKRVVYASAYGAGARKLADILQDTYENTLQLLASFHRTFPSLRAFGRSVVQQCLEGGGLRSAAGRRRALPALGAAHAAARAQAQRQAVNFVVQASAADICKMAMVEASARLDGRASLLLQIHDELVWELPREYLHEAASILRSAMEGCARGWGLPRLPVQLRAGPSWADMEILQF